MLSIPEDIIWRIVVMLSLTVEQKQLLRLIRRLSQVCRSWRSVAISTSTIWGRALDMDVLGASSRHWSYEVIRRSGNSPLHVFGTVYGNRRRSSDLFVSLLKHHWSRFEVLDIEVFNREELSVWDTFCKEPAPSLVSFRLSCYGQGHIPNAFNASLFSGHAPKLRKLQFEWGGHQYSLYSTKWINQLREIELSAPLSVPKGLDLLVKMRDLEVLTISRDIFCLTSPLPSSQIQIVLPNLRSIAISGTLGTAIAFLSHITPSEAWCTLRILTLPQFQPASHPVSPSDMDHFESTLTTYSYSILTSKTLPHASKSISMNLDDGHYAFFTADPGTTNEPASIDIHHVAEPHIQFNLDTLLRILLPCPLDMITYFRFVLSKPPEEEIRLSHDSLQLKSFIFALTSVRIIVLSVHSLEILYNDSRTSEEQFFPHLVEIRLAPTDQSLLKVAVRRIISIITSRRGRSNLRRIERLRLYGALRLRDNYLWIMEKLNDTEVTWE